MPGGEDMKLACTVCEQDIDSKRQALCTGCAQAILYEPRIHHAAALLDRETHHTHAEAVLRPGNDGLIAALSEEANWDAVHAAVTAGVQKHSAVKASEEKELIESRISNITEKAAELRRQIDGYKEFVERQKTLHASRRDDLAHERKELEKQQPRALDPVDLSIRKARQRLEKVQSRTIEARKLLCQESARLSGLRKRKSKDGRSRYWIGGVPIPDLRELNGKLDLGTTSEGEILALPHEVAGAAMNNICRLLGTCCHYLSIRLPAEILLPTNESPHATILPEKSSYKFGSSAYRDMLSSRSASPAASRLLDRTTTTLPRPRPLHIEKPLHELFKQDPRAFLFYIEGVMSLAWDIAWLCRSQGMDSINSFDDICAIGRNLHTLLLSSSDQTQIRPSLERNISTATRQSDHSKPAMAGPATTIRLGAFSHSSVRNSLAGHAGLARLEKWRLASCSRLVDRLRSYLQNEISGAEWDFISGGEWDEEEEHDRPVMVGGARRAVGPAMSVMTVRPSDDIDDGHVMGDRRGLGGWMKVRGRGVEG